MLKLIIEDDEGRKTVVPFVRDEITVGRQEGNTIRLTERNVSRRHARLIRHNGHVIVEDLGSYNGIRVNGEKVEGKSEIHDGDLVQIGDYDLAIQTEGQQERPPPPAGGPPVLERQTGHGEPPTESSVPAHRSSAEPAARAQADDDEPTAPTPPEALQDGARRQSTSVIRVDQIASNRSRQIVDIDPNDAPRLVILTTEFAGREFACIRSELKIGRTEDNDIGIDHRSLSRTHAKVVREDSGEWRVIDMQSANGTAVNGETYAQASLQNGDVITLGHVKVKFVGAGASFTFDPGKDYEKDSGRSSGGGKNAVPLFIVGGVVLVGLIGAGAYMALKPKDGGVVVEPQPEQRVEVVKQPEPPPDQVEPRDPAQEQPTETPTGEETPAPQLADMDEKIAAAKTAIDKRAFDKAADILESVKNSDGTRPKQVESLLDGVNAEILFKKNLAAAQKAFDTGKHDEALRLIEESEGTLAYAEDLQKLKAKVEAARGQADKQLAAKQKAEEAAAAKAQAEEEKRLAAEQKKQQAAEEKKRLEEEKRLAAEEKKKADEEKRRKLAEEKKLAAQNSTKLAKASAGEEAKKLLEEGIDVFKSKQYAEAGALFRRCLEQDAKAARCHLMLGSTYAKLKQVDKGAYHYRQFVQLAPNDDQTPAVRKLLEQYDASKKQQ